MPRYLPRERQVSWRRLLTVGIAIAVLVGMAGAALEVQRLGTSAAAATAKVEARVRDRFAEMMAALSAVTSSLAADPATARALAAGADGERTLFDLIAGVRPARGTPDEIALTIYDQNGAVRAWAGRPSDTFEKDKDRTTGPAAFFVTQSSLGLRLVEIHPIVSADGTRLGSIAAEHVLSRTVAPISMTSSDFTFSTPLGPVALRMRWEGAGEGTAPGTFVLQAASGEPLAEASVDPRHVEQARREWRADVAAAVLTVLSVVLVLLIGPLLDKRQEAQDGRTFARHTVVASALLLLGTATLWTAASLACGGRPDAWIVLPLAGIAMASFIGLWASPALRLRLTRRATRRSPLTGPARFAVTQLTAGVVVAILLVAFERGLDLSTYEGAADLRHFSLHPLTAARVGLLAGILALHVAALWAATLVFVVAQSGWRLPHSGLRSRLALMAMWTAPSIMAVGVASVRGWPLPVGGVLLASASCGLAATYAPRVVGWYRHTTVAARILALFLLFLFPAVLLYPSTAFFAERATRRLVATKFAPQAKNHLPELQEHLAEAMREVDELSFLPGLVRGTTDLPLARPRADSAYYVWDKTALSRARLTSAVELYDRNGDLISPFALNLSEYTGTAQIPHGISGCDWDTFSEANPFGFEWPPMLHAGKHVCVPDDRGELQPVGSIVLHVLFDYRTLPFITSQNPYFELFRPTEGALAREGTAGDDVEVVLYSWGLRPVYTSGRSAWPITDDLFERIYDASRTPFWVRLHRGDETHEVYFANDRLFIYALGYPTPALFDRLVYLTELTTLAGLGFVAVLIGTAIFTRFGRGTPRIGRALLREIRASFYRKLFLAFALASVVPVLILALVIRAYTADLLRLDVQAEATRTAAVVQRVIEQSEALQRRSADGFAPASDDVMVWISQLVDQDVNVFRGPELVATSERDLFSSGLLPTRTPVDVYRAITLQRLPSFVGEDTIGTLPYMIAAAPVRVSGRDSILTVPLANRQREIDREIDDLDRGVQLAALFFVLLGAGIGVSLAERIADPVRRLTRATRRIASGDFDARIAVRSADELKRLVDAFNSMAGELKAQRSQLERTHRLEAWAEMARQVAHEIKNPLTPIQLSAEHLHRVHVDRGKPMGPVLENCVTSILNQVRLLRQISSEFSSFASSPTAKLAPVDLPRLIADVVDPYRTGLSGRIEIVNSATGPLPPVMVDYTLVTRALSNIVENALHAMPGTGRLTIDAATVDGAVALSVSDTGVGMDPDALARVFEPYFSTKTTGTGLGLPIARRNIELNGGTIEVQSQKGTGTRVTVRLPIAD